MAAASMNRADTALELNSFLQHNITRSITQEQRWTTKRLYESG